MERTSQINPRRKPSQERSKETVDAILEAAVQVFAKMGYQGGTTNHIAERAGVSVGTLYQYFPNKEAVLFGLMERHSWEMDRHIEQMMASLEAGGELDQNSIRKIVVSMLDVHRLEPSYHRIIIEEIPEAQQAIVKWSRAAEFRAIELVEKILAGSNRLRVKNLRLAASNIVHTVNWLTHRYVLYDRDKIEEEDFVEELVDMLGRYILP